MRIAIDTATHRTGIALVEGTQIIGEVYEEGATAHGEALPRLAQQLLKDIDRQQINSVAVGMGPGPYTGLRVGIAFAHSFASALSIPVVPVCTLDIIAAEVICDREFAVATDARRKEIYWARYNAHGKRIGNIKVVAPQSLAEEERWLPTAGQASNLYVDLFPFVLEPTLPSVGVMAVRAESLALSDSSPLYLRHPDATPPGVAR